MRHRINKHSFGRKPDPRKALMRGLVNSLVEHERICTTLPKAKELRRYVEKAITKGKEDTVHVRRTLLSDYPNKKTVSKIVDDLGPRFKERPGGYTRILKAGPRPGDMADMAYIEFVDYEAPEATGDETVEGDAGVEAREKLAAKRALKHRKRVRQLQKADRIRSRK